MKKVAALIAFCMVAMVAATIVTAADEAKATEVAGVVAVVKDGDAVKSISITGADKVVVDVVLDAEGKKLADMDKKSVKVTGVVAEKDGKKSVTVQKAAVVEAPKADK
jgi:hypothetical protein